ncbi:unnamed protein product [Anisakis simplex]|uniref:Uncharacterized protein n=1 Tax=Anisakis simplex TaxID=6269 RepID=A0A0M3K0E7_ANISI|nr:unnamed protein product [Anisakis simplex]
MEIGVFAADLIIFLARHGHDGKFCGDASRILVLLLVCSEELDGSFGVDRIVSRDGTAWDVGFDEVTTVLRIEYDD